MVEMEARGLTVDPVVLYDRFFEAGTALAGAYLRFARAASTPTDNEFWMDQLRALYAQRQAVPTDDTDQLLTCLENWTRTDRQLHRLAQAS